MSTKQVIAGILAVAVIGAGVYWWRASQGTGPEDGVRSAGSIRIEEVWARPLRMPEQPMTGGGGHGDNAGMAMTGPTSAAYMTIRNTGREDDTLLGASTDAAAAAELHETKMSGDVMQMQPVHRIVIPAGGEAVLKPGGLHVMLLGVKEELAPGSRFALRLEFERAGEVELMVDVREP